MGLSPESNLNSSNFLCMLIFPRDMSAEMGNSRHPGTCYVSGPHPACSPPGNNPFFIRVAL